MSGVSSSRSRSALDVEGGHNRAYVKLVSVDNRKKPTIANIEIDVAPKPGKVKRTRKRVRCGDDLFELSGGRDGV